MIANLYGRLRQVLVRAGQSLNRPRDVALMGVFAAGYFLVGWLSLAYFAPAQGIGVFWPASGLALSIVLFAGWRYAPSVFVGTWLLDAYFGSPWYSGVGTGLSMVLEMWVAEKVLKRHRHWSVLTFETYRQLVLYAAPLGAIASAVTGVLAMTASGVLPLDQYASNTFRWAVGDMIGMTLVVPAAVLWFESKRVRRLRLKVVAEALLLLALTIAMGGVLFLGWDAPIRQWWRPMGYMLVPVLVWASLRLGTWGTLALLSVMACQVMMGAQGGTGFFSMEDMNLRLLNAWMYVSVVSFMALALAIKITDQRRLTEDLRIAATAFECQEGVMVTDARGNITRINRSSQRMSGVAACEVLGRSPDFMLSDRHPDTLFIEAFNTARQQGSWEGEVWCKARAGDLIPQLVMVTAVKTASGRISHFVLTHVDITNAKRAEEQRLTAEIALREDLIREIHHRIKNNLQGVIGVLGQFGATHPELREPISESIAIVKSISALHGLKGVSPDGLVHWVDLVELIAADVAKVWGADVQVEFSARKPLFSIVESEAVPIALVINELIINAVKHGRRQPTAPGPVHVDVASGNAPDAVKLVVSNRGVLTGSVDGTGSDHRGLQLVRRLLPRFGADLNIVQDAGWVRASLVLWAPVVRPMRAPESDPPVTAKDFQGSGIGLMDESLAAKIRT